MEERSPQNMQSCLDLYLEATLFEKGLSEQTLAAYGADLRRYIRHLDENAITESDAIVREDLLDYLATLHAEGLQARSVARHLSVLRSFHRFLLSEGCAQQDPTDTLDGPKLTAALPHVLRQDEVERLLAAPDREDPPNLRDAAILALFYACGLRISELANLPMHHVSLEEGQVRVQGKGGKVRLVPLGRRAQDRLA